ncbi:MAG: [citrate (pro-3S)-lyase] ligase [Clostridium perfringens]|nr:[citrate (pro-3S)-lyase] ligase [Clostridium perfringens]
MEYYNFEEVIIEDRSDFALKALEKFLKGQDLDLDENLDYTIILYDNDKIIGSGSFKKNILKCIAISDDYKGFGISNKIISGLVNEQYRRGYSHIFIYTKPKNGAIFRDFGFYDIESVGDKVLLLENKKNGIEKYCNELIKETPKYEGDKVAGIVANCNPFTLGHRFLIEKASKENDLVHLFILWEDESKFSNKARYEMVREGITDLHNVVLHKAKDYIISSATFPSYFIKEKNDVLSIQAILDSKIFAKYIAKPLNITKRYVGTEPFSKSTEEYNKQMKRVLNENNIKLMEVPRKEFLDEEISASKVRKLLEEKQFEYVKELVPITTYKYLLNM